MYVIIWKYRVKADHVTEFEEIYSATGAWAKLFQKSKGYLGTELLSDEGHPRRPHVRAGTPCDAQGACPREEGEGGPEALQRLADDAPGLGG